MSKIDNIKIKKLMIEFSYTSISVREVCMEGLHNFINPITKTDYPDVDVIRVDDTYYMISTTMYFMPGGVILRSYDLVNWEIASYIFDKLDGTPEERLEGDLGNYGKGMWAATLRYNKGKFYAAFVSHGRKDTHLFISDDINGPWEHRLINEYYHDCSLLFDDDGKVYIISGNMNIRLVELNDDFTGPREGGIDKIIIRDNPDKVGLGYEGAHFYKIGGYYYVTLIHWPKYNGRRTEAVYVSSTVDGEYVGRDVMEDDMGFHDRGVAQGGIVQTADDKWYAILFRDSGAVGRIPVLMPVFWKMDEEFGCEFPVFGCDGVIPRNMEVIEDKGIHENNPIVSDDGTITYVYSTRPGYEYEPLYTSDDFKGPMKMQWQWNHLQDDKLWKFLPEGGLEITTDKICNNVTHARNSLTQRMMYPECEGYVTVDASNLNEGDVAGICALEGCYGLIGIMKEDSEFYLVVIERKSVEKPFAIGFMDYEPGEITYKQRIGSSKVRIGLQADFEDMHDKLEFYYVEDTKKKVGGEHQLTFGLDHFTGARFALFVFSTKQTGGKAVFTDFEYVY